MIGQTLSHFRILDKIGAGGMGVVYRAEDTKLRRHVALKVLPPDVVTHVELRRRFLREARTAAAVNHPNVATIYEVDEADGVVFIAMELVEGKTLRSLVRGRPLPVSNAIGYGCAIARGLAEAHKTGVIHRDLKPENVIVGPEQQVKILDFGLAKLIEGREEVTRSRLSQAPTMTEVLTREHQILGTLNYMSPEQAGGQPVDARSDLFSFGVVLHEMLTGRRPFREGTTYEVLDSIKHDQVAPASRHNRDVPPDLDRLLAQCLEKDPEKRYQTSAELVEALEAIKSPTPWRWAKLTLLTLLPAVLLVVILEVMGFIDLASDWPPGPPPATALIDLNTVAVFPFTVRGDAIDHMSEGMVDLLGAMLNAGEVRGVDSYALLAALSQEENRGSAHGPLEPGRARRLAGELGAGRFVLGTIVQTGSVVNVNASLYDTNGNGEAIEQARAQGPEDQVAAVVDKIAIQILEVYVPDPEPGTLTENFEALTAYLQGQRLYREGSFKEAKESYQHAVEEDPSFALAHYRMALAAFWGDPSSLKESLEEALRHCQKLPARHCQLAEAYRAAWVSGDAEEGIRLAQDLITRYPDEVDAWHLLGETRFFFGKAKGDDLDEAREALERALEYDPKHFPTLDYLWWLAGIEERYEDATEILRRIYPLHAAGDFAPLWEVYVACTEGDEAKIQQAIDVLSTERHTAFMSIAVGTLISFHHDLDCAERVARKLLESSPAPEWKAVGYGRLAQIDLMRGQWSKAKAKLDEMQKLDGSARATWQRASVYLTPFIPVARAELETLREEVSKLGEESVEDRIYRDYLLGHLNARLDDPVAALQHAEELMAIWKELEDGEGSSDWVGPWVRHLAQSVRAQVAGDRGNPGDALLEAEKIHPEELWLKRHSRNLVEAETLERYLRAVLLEDQGRDEEALRWYRAIGYNSGGNIYRAPIHFWIGQIHERRDDREQAIEHYSRFIDWWKDCDPELRPLVDDATARLQRLKR